MEEFLKKYEELILEKQKLESRIEEIEKKLVETKRD